MRCTFVDRYLQGCPEEALEGKQHCHTHEAILSDAIDAGRAERDHWNNEGQKRYDPAALAKPKVWERPFDDVEFEDTSVTTPVDLDAMAAEQAELEREYGID